MKKWTMALATITLVTTTYSIQAEEKTPPAPSAEPTTPKESKTMSDPIAAIEAFIEKQSINKENKRWRTNIPKFPEVEFPEEKTYFWHLKTNKGELKIKFYAPIAPHHVASTIYLTKLGFYDNLIFHRVIPGFMAQGGCPLGRGTSGPGYEYHGEFKRDVRHNKPGLLSMANRGPGTDGSQFFLTFVPTPHLDGRHTLFGEIVDGMDTLKALEACGTAPRGQTTEELKIESAAVSVE